MSAWDSADLMAIVMARLIKNGKVTFVGVNSPLPFVAVTLAKRLHAPEAIFISISGGINPTPARLMATTSCTSLAAGSPAILDNQDFYGLNGRGGVDTTFLGMGQVDVNANVNSSVIGNLDTPKVRLPGGGGGPAIMPSAREVILWRAGHSKKIFVEKVDFVTSAGNVSRVVTPLCVFCKEAGRLVLESIHPGVTRADLAERTGFAIAGLDTAPVTPEPTEQELAVLHTVDPDGVRYSEFPGQRAADAH